MPNMGKFCNIWKNNVLMFATHSLTKSNYSHQYHHHHRPRRKYGPYMVPSDPYLLHSGPSDYFFAGSAANATANLGANLTSVPPQHQQRPAAIQQRPNTLR